MFTYVAIDIAVARGALALAARLLGRAEAQWHSPHRTARLEEHHETLEAALGDRFETLRQAGAAMSDGDVIAELAAATEA